MPAQRQKNCERSRAWGLKTTASDWVELCLWAEIDTRRLLGDSVPALKAQLLAL